MVWVLERCRRRVFLVQKCFFGLGTLPQAPYFGWKNVCLVLERCRRRLFQIFCCISPVHSPFLANSQFNRSIKRCKNWPNRKLNIVPEQFQTMPKHFQNSPKMGCPSKQKTEDDPKQPESHHGNPTKLGYGGKVGLKHEGQN